MMKLDRGGVLSVGLSRGRIKVLLGGGVDVEATGTAGDLEDLTLKTSDGQIEQMTLETLGPWRGAPSGDGQGAKARGRNGGAIWAGVKTGDPGDLHCLRIVMSEGMGGGGGGVGFPILLGGRLGH